MRTFPVMLVSKGNEDCDCGSARLMHNIVRSEWKIKHSWTEHSHGSLLPGAGPEWYTILRCDRWRCCSPTQLQNTHCWHSSPSLHLTSNKKSQCVFQGKINPSACCREYQFSILCHWVLQSVFSLVGFEANQWPTSFDCLSLMANSTAVVCTPGLSWRSNTSVSKRDRLAEVAHSTSCHIADKTPKQKSKWKQSMKVHHNNNKQQLKSWQSDLKSCETVRLVLSHSTSV